VKIAWTEIFGDWPELRQNPALKNVKLPEKLGIPGNAGSIVTQGVLASSAAKIRHSTRSTKRQAANYGKDPCLDRQRARR